MSEASSSHIPEEFLQQVRDALAHLYDTAYLQRHELLAHLVPDDLADPRARAQTLREMALQAIAALRPPSGVKPHDPAYRPYAILRGRYLEGMTSEEVQEALAIGRRQYFREQQRAIEGIAGILWSKRIAVPEQKENGLGEALSEELKQLGVQPEAFSLPPLVQEAITATSSLASDAGVLVTLEPAGRIETFADRAITRHLLISLLGTLVRQSAGARLAVSVSHDARWVCVTITNVGPGPAPDLQMPAEPLTGQLATQKHLAEHLGGFLSVEPEGAAQTVRLRLPSDRKDVVAIVDDNPRTLRLFERYLEPYRYQPMLIQESTQALAEIRATQPDVVVLDIMMRDIDGWQLLQSLRTDPTTRHIAVLVCSVLNDVDLARSLGAAGYLRKPVSQAELVRALDLARRDRGGEPGRSPAPSPANV